MDETAKALLDEIGREAISSAKDVAGRVLVYAEVSDEVVEADIVYASEAGPMKLKAAPSALLCLIADLRAMAKSAPPHHAWCVMAYTFDQERFTCHHIYPDQIRIKGDRRLRRDHFVFKYFHTSDLEPSEDDEAADVSPRHSSPLSAAAGLAPSPPSVPKDSSAHRRGRERRRVRR